jgi:hypothetical protein
MAGKQLATLIWAPKSDHMQGKIRRAEKTGILRGLHQTFKRRAVFWTGNEQRNSEFL